MKQDNVDSRSRITEVDAVAKKLFSTYETSGLTGDAHLSKMFGELGDNSVEMTGAIGSIATESDLDDSDANRDVADRTLFNFVKGQCSHPSKVVRENAEIVWDVLDSFGVGIVGESYSIQTSLEDSMLEKLADPKIVESIEKVPGVDTLISAVKRASSDFAKAHIEFKKAKAGDTQRCQLRR